MIDFEAGFSTLEEIKIRALTGLSFGTSVNLVRQPEERGFDNLWIGETSGSSIGGSWPAVSGRRLVLALFRFIRPGTLTAVHPTMLQLAGELTDSVLLARVPVREVPHSLEEIAKGTASVGRTPVDIDIGCFPVTYVSLDGERRRLVTCAISCQFAAKLKPTSKAFGAFAIATWLMKSCMPGRLGICLGVKQRFQGRWSKTFVFLVHHNGAANVLNALSKLVFKCQWSRRHH